VGKRLSQARNGHTNPISPLAIRSQDRSIQGTAFKSPTPQTEDLYIKSVNTTVDHYRALLEGLRTSQVVALPNCDLDSGNPTRAAEYSLADETYAKLLAQLANRDFDLTTPPLRENIVQFYSDLSAPIETKKGATRWQSLLVSLDQLKSAVPAPGAAISAAK